MKASAFFWATSSVPVSSGGRCSASCLTVVLGRGPVGVLVSGGWGFFSVASEDRARAKKSVASTAFRAARDCRVIRTSSLLDGVATSVLLLTGPRQHPRFVNIQSYLLPFPFSPHLAQRRAKKAARGTRSQPVSVLPPGKNRPERRRCSRSPLAEQRDHRSAARIVNLTVGQFQTPAEDHGVGAFRPSRGIQVDDAVAAARRRKLVGRHRWGAKARQHGGSAGNRCRGGNAQPPIGHELVIHGVPDIDGVGYPWCTGYRRRW